ncbi:MAG: Pup--protein ligase [Nitrospirae bacterium RIFCSPHIGHO2_01_FULL_66_17]|nr:MAG: Pup--protein ligase [Nitrospirae bacterium RIFCSPHIGHO2_01_FULL_66_17]
MPPRIFGLENEYGLIFSPNGRVYLPMEKILGYIFEGLIPNSWPSNAFLCNGARFYQDTGCHPEYSTPECDHLRDLVIHDKAGERLLEACLPMAEKRLREEGLIGEIYIFKNNTDSMGNTYGCHENYLMRRDLDFWKITEQLIPFFVTRQIFAGAGKVLKVSGRTHFFLSQRAQHIHEKTSSSTTSSRSIINTRDEPHADAEKYRRLHIIVGDSNMSELATYLKVGTTAVVLSMIEEGFTVKGMELEDPVKAIRDISRDPTLKKRVRLEDGREWTALEIQMTYWERAQAYLAALGSSADETTRDLIEYWGDVLQKLATNPMELAQELDWVIKKNVMDSFIARKNCGWDDPRVALMDLQYHDVKRNRGLYYLLERQDVVERLATEEEIQRAMTVPPQSTRAKVRGDFIKFAKEKNRSYTVDWTYLKLNGYWEETILCMDPFSSSNKRVDELIAGVAVSHR